MSDVSEEGSPHAERGRGVGPDVPLQRLIDGLDLPVCYIDSGERYRYCARAYRALTAHPSHDLVGQRVRDPVGELLCARFKERMAEALNGRRTPFEVPLPAQRGTAADMEVTYVPHVGPGGDVVGFLAHVREVTALTRVAAALRESEQRYRRLFEYDVSGNYVSTPAGELLDCNPAFARMFGFGSVREALGANLRSLYADPDDRERLLDRIRSEKQLRLWDEKLQRSDGTPVYVLGNVVGLFDQRGELEQLFGHLRDDTERRAAEATRDLLVAAVEEAGEAVTITDRQGTVSYVNPAFEAITGYTAGEAIGRNPNILASGEHDEAFYHHLWSTIQSGRVWHGRFVNRRRDGERYDAEATISPVSDRTSGAIVGFVEIQRDISERLSIETHLHQVQRLESVGHLAGAVAHDFNDLLTVIKACADFGLVSVAEGESCAEEFREIASAADRAAALTRQLLAFGGRQALQPQILDLNEIVVEMSRMLGRTLGANVQVRTRLDPELGTVHADPGQLEQVIMNLAVNARDAMPGGGRLDIETANVDPVEIRVGEHADLMAGQAYVVLSVSDSGVGMDEETQARIFEPFFTTRGKDEGSGLGLSTVYGIVKQSGGYVWVYSEPEVGSTFRIYLPLFEGGERSPAPEPAAPASPRGTETVLLVEDNAAVRRAARRALEGYGYTVREAETARDALRLARDHEADIDLLLTDVVLRTSRGPALAAEIAGLRPTMKIMFMSGYGGDQAEVRELAKVTLVRKPFGSDELARKVREVLDGPNDPPEIHGDT